MKAKIIYQQKKIANPFLREKKMRQTQLKRGINLQREKLKAQKKNPQPQEPNKIPIKDALKKIKKMKKQAPRSVSLGCSEGNIPLCSPSNPKKASKSLSSYSRLFRVATPS